MSWKIRQEPEIESFDCPHIMEWMYPIGCFYEESEGKYCQEETCPLRIKENKAKNGV